MAGEKRVAGKAAKEKHFVKADDRIRWYDGLQSWALAQLQMSGCKFGP